MSQGQPQPQPQNPGDLLNPRQGMNLLYWLATGHATCFTVFLRHSFGTEALGRHGITALIIILLYACAVEEPLMLTFFWVWLAALILQRLRTFSLFRKGVVWHSRYAGYPFLAMRSPFVKTEGAAKTLEPLFCLIGGALLCPLSEKLGVFVLTGFVSLLVTRGIETQLVANRRRAMRDASIEQRHMASLFRGETNDF